MYAIRSYYEVWIGDQRISDGWEIKDFEQTLSEFEFMKNASGLVVRITSYNVCYTKLLRPLLFVSTSECQISFRFPVAGCMDRIVRTHPTRKGRLRC